LIYQRRSEFHESLSTFHNTAAPAGARDHSGTATRRRPPADDVSQAPTRDTSYIDAQGTAHVTRIVPVPKTISAEAQRSLSRQMPDQGPPQSLADRRKSTDAYTARARVEWSRLCPNQLVEDRIAGVPVRIVTPEGLPEANRDKVLLNLHGGGFNSDSGSYTESIPIAAYSRMKWLPCCTGWLRSIPFPRPSMIRSPSTRSC